MANLFDVMAKFQVEGTIKSVEPYGSGHINVTYLAVTDKKRYILQKINNNLFTSVDKLMNNIYLVTEHVKNKCPEKTVLTLVKTVEGKPFLAIDGEYYRVYDFIEESVCLQIPRNTSEFYESAVAFGDFTNMLSDFDATQLYEILPNFHNTVQRFKNFEVALKKNLSGRAHLAEDEINFALARKGITSKIVDLIASGKMPLKVTHNDTKLNNVLLHQDTLKGLAVIDLDTVMPGSVCYDFGDSIRFGCNSSYEDEEDLSKVYFKMDMFESYVKGYLSSMSDITEVEKECLVDGAILMTFECGIRFLSDFLDGDTYFKTTKVNHNLFRCRTQFKLVSEMEKNRELMLEIVRKY
jgi:N-acetylhexosamine 1-kinase